MELIFENLIAQGKAASSWGFVNLLYPVVTSLCVIYLHNSFLKPRFKYPCVSAGALPFILHLFTAVLIGWGPKQPQFSYWHLGYLAFLMVLSCFFYRGRLTAKIYLTVIFFTFHLLSLLLFEHTSYSLIKLAARLEFSDTAKKMPELVFYTCPVFDRLPYPGSFFQAVMHNLIYFLALSGTCLLLVLSSRYLAKRLRKRTWEMEWKELVFLLIPAAVGDLFYIFITFVKPFLFEPMAVNRAESYGSILYVIIPLLVVAFLFAVLYSWNIYEQIIVAGEERGKAAMLESEVEQLTKHIQDMEQLYEGIRSMKHDMTNYLFDIKSLLSARGISVDDDKEGLGAYFSGIGGTLERFNYSFYTGNPVTDVIINGKFQQALQLGIDFSSSFYFPKGFGISVFDISVILNNALNNALEACENLKESKPEEPLSVSIDAYCRNNLFFIEIVNTFDGRIKYEKKDNILVTRKENAFEHGLGFQNIRKCAEKYLGLAEFCYDAKRFSVTVMLQKAWD